MSIRLQFLHFNILKTLCKFHANWTNRFFEKFSPKCTGSKNRMFEKKASQKTKLWKHGKIDMNKSKHHSNSYSLKLSRRIGWFSKFCLFFCQSSFLKLLVTSFVSLFHFHMAFLQTLCFFLDSFFFLQALWFHFHMAFLQSEILYWYGTLNQKLDLMKEIWQYPVTLWRYFMTPLLIFWFSTKLEPFSCQNTAEDDSSVFHI